MGAGINLFKTLFPSDYYPYTANTLMSAKPTGKKIVGFNQWDEEWELSGSNVKSKNPIKVFPNTTYYMCCPVTADIDIVTSEGTYVAYLTSKSNATFTTPNNCEYIRFTMRGSYGTTYNHDICINISSSKNGTYEPYSETTIVYSGNELRGLLKVGTNGLYADGDTDDGSGTGAVRYGIVDLGSLNWVYDSGVPRFYSTDLSTVIKKPTDNNIPANVICSKYPTANGNAVFATSDLIVAISTGGAVNIKDSNYTSKSAFETAMNGVYLIYELATPTTQTISAWTNPIVAKEGGTEEFIDGNFYGCVDLGSLTWVKIGMGGGRNGFRATINEMALTPAANVKINAICSKYITYTGNEVYLGNIGISGWGANTHDIAIYDPDYESGDAPAFKTAMNGVYLIYENTNSVGFQMFTGHDTIYGTDLSVNKAEFGTTVYGGSVDFTTGEVISNKNADGTDKTAETISITPVPIMANFGANNLMSDTNGDTTVQYLDLRSNG